jgi:hypothetical protein
LRDALYGPIIPAHLDEHLKRYTRASGEFELAFGREPKAGDILHYEHMAFMHSSENYSSQFGRVIDAWQSQLPHVTCPLKFEGGRLFRRLVPERRGEEPKWKENVRIQPQMRWLEIPEVIENTDLDPRSSEAVVTIPAIVFLGVVGAKHQCRPATGEELQRVRTESPLKAPTFFKYGWQTYCELLVEVFGA